MERMVYIPDGLWAQLQEYLSHHPGANPASVIQEALVDKLRPKNAARLLEVAGLVENAPSDASVNEDAGQ